MKTCQNEINIIRAIFEPILKDYKHIKISESIDGIRIFHGHSSLLHVDLSGTLIKLSASMEVISKINFDMMVEIKSFDLNNPDSIQDLSNYVRYLADEYQRINHQPSP